MTFDDSTMRAHSIAANAMQEMRQALGRGERRPTDHDLDLQFQAAKILMQMERDPAPSLGALRPSFARPTQTVAQRLAEKLDEDALLGEIKLPTPGTSVTISPATRDDT